MSGDVMSCVIKMRIKQIIPLLFSAAGLAILLSVPKAASDAVMRGLQYTASLLIPSLFPFMVLSSFMIRSGASELLGRLFAPITVHLFRLPEQSAAAILLSVTGGYPVGAKCVKLLYSAGQITQHQAERMMLFCVCSGPAYMITALGAMSLGNITSGVILYTSQLFSSLLIGIITARLCHHAEASSQRPKDGQRNSQHNSLLDAFILSCSDSAVSVLQLTALVAVFSLFLEALEQTRINRLITSAAGFAGIDAVFSGALVYSLMEVTTACQKICSGGALWMLSFAAGFGGLCVHTQIFSVLGEMKINKAKFLLFRLLNAVISSGFTYAVCMVYRPIAGVFVMSDGRNAELTSTTAAGGIALVVMSALFVLSMHSRSGNERGILRNRKKRELFR